MIMGPFPLPAVLATGGKGAFFKGFPMKPRFRVGERVTLTLTVAEIDGRKVLCRGHDGFGPAGWPWSALGQRRRKAGQSFFLPIR
jgi:hypothetical protein